MVPLALETVLAQSSQLPPRISHPLRKFTPAVLPDRLRINPQLPQPGRQAIGSLALGCGPLAFGGRSIALHLRLAAIALAPRVIPSENFSIERVIDEAIAPNP
jgi:hypothetical protein